MKQIKVLWFYSLPIPWKIQQFLFSLHKRKIRKILDEYDHFILAGIGVQKLTEVLEQAEENKKIHGHYNYELLAEQLGMSEKI